MNTVIDVSFENIALEELAAMSTAECDRLPFGVIGFDRDRIARVYNATESQSAGMPPSSVIGSHFFEVVAQCMNNFLVAQRFADEDELDEVVPFVLTLRMRPTPVRLRLLSSSAEPLQYVLIQR